MARWRGGFSFNSCAWEAALVPTREYLAARPLRGRKNIACLLKGVKAAMSGVRASCCRVRVSEEPLRGGVLGVFVC